MPSLFALGAEVLRNSTIATFAAFGAFAMLLLVDFTGTRRERFEAMLWLGVVGAGLVCIATLVQPVTWLAVLAMAVVGFAVLFAGVVSSVLANASTSLLLAFILPVVTPGPISSIADRLAGWGLASAASLFAITVLWPAPPRNPLRRPALECCRLIANRLRADVAFVTGELTETAALEAAHRAATEATDSLRSAFFATPNRPTGLGTPARTMVRLVDELGWLAAVLDQTQVRRRRPDPTVLALKLAAADVLETGAAILADPTPGPELLRDAVARLRARLDEMENAAMYAEVELVDALEPTFRAQEIAFIIAAIAANIDATVQAERRHLLQRVLGQQPDTVVGVTTAARQRAVAHLDPHSVWLHNSVRGAIGLALAVLVADLTGAQHSFWVVLGTLSVLRSNALSTGQTALRGVLGTVLGIVVGGVIVVGVGTDHTLLWILLPLSVVVAGLAPATISFAAGQAAFTMTLVILFNIISPVGYKVGLVRLEDVAMGVTVSLAVGVLFWPRGAAGVLGRALAEAYRDSARYLDSAVRYGVQRCDAGRPSLTPPTTQALAAAAAARRLDDAFREYLIERGNKRLHLAEVTTLVTGVIAPRLVADAVLDLWQREDGRSTGARTAAGAELTAAAERTTAWYDAFGAALAGEGAVPLPAERDPATDGRLIAAVRRDLADESGIATPTAVRMIWTGDHLDAVRRLETTLIEPALVTAGRGN